MKTLYIKFPVNLILQESSLKAPFTCPLLLTVMISALNSIVSRRIIRKLVTAKSQQTLSQRHELVQPDVPGVVWMAR